MQLVSFQRNHVLVRDRAIGMYTIDLVRSAALQGVCLHATDLFIDQDILPGSRARGEAPPEGGRLPAGCRIDAVLLKGTEDDLLH